GIRLECAQCHKHPMDRWTQADYRAYANVFSQITFGASPETQKLLAEANKGAKTKGNQGSVLKEVYVGTPKGTMSHPETNQKLDPKALGGPEIKTEGKQDYRVALYEWMRSADNPFFARSFANRVWGHYFGIGIVN